MKNLVKTLISDESGTETVEWGLMAGLIVGGLVLTVAAIGSWVRIKFETLQENLESAPTV